MKPTPVPSSGDAFARLVGIVQALRTPVTGCPWDLEQTHESIRRYLVEETYEVLDAIENSDDPEFVIELGDLLLQVVLHAQIARDRGAFQIDDVIERISEKLIRRHPHVFGEGDAKTSGEVVKRWEEIKQSEKPAGEEKRSVLAGVPRAMPALLRAQRLGEKASRAKFDWGSARAVWDKIEEELGELKAEFQASDGKTDPSGRIAEELGDMLFALAQFARWMNLDSEDALKGSADRFTARFEVLEKRLGERLWTASEEELEKEWQEVKRLLAAGKQG